MRWQWVHRRGDEIAPLDRHRLRQCKAAGPRAPVPSSSRHGVCALVIVCVCLQVRMGAYDDFSRVVFLIDAMKQVCAFRCHLPFKRACLNSCTDVCSSCYSCSSRISGRLHACFSAGLVLFVGGSLCMSSSDSCPSKTFHYTLPFPAVHSALRVCGSACVHMIDFRVSSFSLMIWSKCVRSGVIFYVHKDLLQQRHRCLFILLVVFSNYQ